MSRVPRYSIVLPAFDEAARIGRTLDELAAWLDRREDTEVLVVAGGSDATAQIAREHAAAFAALEVIVPGPGRGKGHDVRAGMLAARGDYRLFMDADLATPLRHLPAAWAALEAGADVVIAERDLAAIHTGARALVSVWGNRLIRLTLLPGVRDSQCGFKGFTAAAAQELFTAQTLDGWGFDLELLAGARRRGYRVETVAVRDWSDEPGGAFGGTRLAGAAAATLSELAVLVWRRLRG